jgi:hypothetical protein
LIAPVVEPPPSLPLEEQVLRDERQRRLLDEDSEKGGVIWARFGHPLDGLLLTAGEPRPRVLQPLPHDRGARI